MTRTALCTSAQALRTAKVDEAEEVGGDDAVSDAIEEAREEVLDDYGDPPKRSTFIIDSSQTKYEFQVNKKKVYAIEKVYIINGNNERTEYTDGDEAGSPPGCVTSETNKKYCKDLDFNSITFHSDTISANSGYRVIVDYIPNAIHWLARLKAALYLIDNMNVTNAEENTPTKGLRILQRINRIENGLIETNAVGSEDEKIFETTYGELIKQRTFHTN